MNKKIKNKPLNSNCIIDFIVLFYFDYFIVDFILMCAVVESVRFMSLP